MPRWEAAEPSPQSLFGAAFLPGIVLGPPGESLPYQGTVTVASLGFGGSAVVEFRDIVIEDRPGPDFIVFENGFFQLPLPTSASDDFSIFAEPGTVEVSSDGVQWFAFNFDAAALDEWTQAAGAGLVDREMHGRLRGLAGITPSFSGNWTIADDPELCDPLGQGGVSGAGGDAFDLADVGLSEARFIRITDVDSQVGFGGAAEGFDLDAVVVLHGKPVAPSALDSDGDGLSDLAEQTLYGTSPFINDDDGDGLDDGREVASCRDPRVNDDAAWYLPEPRLWLIGDSCTELRWSYLDSASSYNLLRGELGAPIPLGGFVDLGPTVCLSAEQSGLRWGCDADPLPSGSGFIYLVQPNLALDWGRDSDMLPRGNGGECP